MGCHPTLEHIYIYTRIYVVDPIETLFPAIMRCNEGAESILNNSCVVMCGSVPDCMSPKPGICRQSVDYSICK